MSASEESIEAKLVDVVGPPAMPGIYGMSVLLPGSSPYWAATAATKIPKQPTNITVDKLRAIIYNQIWIQVL